MFLNETTALKNVIASDMKELESFLIDIRQSGEITVIA